MPNDAAVARFLARQDPVTDLLNPFVAGDADWDTTRDALAAMQYADVPQLSVEERMGDDGGAARADRTPGDDPIPGSWPELVLAGDLGILTTEQVREVLGLIAGKGSAEPVEEPSA